MPFTKINEVEIYYEKSGEPNPEFPVIILIHGLTADHTFWREFVKYYAARTEVWVFDLPGHGKSRYANIDYTIEFLGDILKGFIEHFDIKKPLLFGHSMGGFAVLQYEITYPGTAVGLVCLGTTPGIIKLPKPFLLFIQPSVNLFMNAFFKNFVRTLRAITFPKSTPKEELQESIYRGWAGNRNAIASYASNFIFNYDLRPHLSGIKIPVITLVGSKDMAKMLLPYFKNIPNLSVKVIKGATHDFLISHAPLLIRLIEEFRLEKIKKK